MSDERYVLLPCKCGKVHRLADPGRSVKLACPASGDNLLYECFIEAGDPVLRYRGKSGLTDWPLRTGTIELGRNVEGGIRLEQSGISRRHCRFIVSDDGCSVEDLGSSNGTYLNEERLEPETPSRLSGGDLVRISGIYLRFLEARKASPIASAGAGASASTSAGSEAGDALVGKTLEEFHITGLLAQGGMGRVYTAVREGDGLECVVKTIIPESGGSERIIERFLREMELATILDHPNIITPLSGGEYEGRLYLAMERFDGVDLRKRFLRKPAPVKGVILIGKQAASALAHAHEKGIIHRDIKPENILADNRGNTKILDFGIAKLLYEEDFSSLTMTHGSLGTPAFMSPEQMKNPKAVDGRSDVYALGCTLFFCLTGHNPYPGKNMIQICRAAQAGPPDLASERPETPDAFADLILRCMNIDPEARPESAASLLAALEKIAD